MVPPRRVHVGAVLALTGEDPAPGRLGPEHDGAAVDIVGDRQRALLFRLALDRGTTVGYRAIAEDVWPDDLPENARAALQSLVSRLRSQLPADIIESTPGGYRLAIAARRRRRRALPGSRGRGIRGRDDPSEAARLAAEALALWAGEPWTPDAGYDWFERDLARRSRRRRLRSAPPHAPRPRRSSDPRPAHGPHRPRTTELARVGGPAGDLAARDDPRPRRRGQDASRDRGGPHAGRAPCSSSSRRPAPTRCGRPCSARSAATSAPTTASVPRASARAGARGDSAAASCCSCSTTASTSSTRRPPVAGDLLGAPAAAARPRHQPRAARRGGGGVRAARPARRRPTPRRLFAERVLAARGRRARRRRAGRRGPHPRPTRRPAARARARRGARRAR